MLVSRQWTLVRVMFPFGLSLFDVGLMLIMLIIIVVLVVLYLIVLVKLEPSTEERSNHISPNESQEEPVERPELVSPVHVKTEKTETSQEARSSGCPHHFGYLKEYPKNTPIPNECFTCTKIMECLLGAE
ncbi:MAG: hypothetical protein ACE5J6_00410 [Candidatus Bathyarchaeia archaeon]